MVDYSGLGLGLRTAVNGALGMFPAKWFSQCLVGARLAAFQLCVLEAITRALVLKQVLLWHSDRLSGGRGVGERVEDGHSIRQAGMEQCCCNTEPGSIQLRERRWSIHNHG